MPVGTIALTNNSPNVVGTGTTFNNDLKVNDYIVVVVGQIAYQVAVKSVNSNTSATLVLNYDGPTASGLAWNPVSPATLGVLSQSAAADTARAFRQQQLWAENWQKLLTTNGPVTINNPDGRSTNGIGWPALDAAKANKSDLTALDAAKANKSDVTALTNRVGVVEANKANKNELGTAATRNVGTSANDLMEVGAFGVGTNFGVTTPTIYPSGVPSTVTEFNRAAQNTNFPTNGRFAGLTMMYSTGFSCALVAAVDSVNPVLSYRGSSNSSFGTWQTIYSTVNTTVDASGFIKRASPVVKIFADGQSELNDESEGVIVIREGVGVYRIENVFGLNSDAGWGGIDGGFDVPQDRNKQPLIWLDYSVDADGSVIVKTFHRTNPNAPAFARNIIDGIEEGEPIDIPADQFVSVRVQMPEDSAWNIKQREVVDSLEQEPSS